MKIFNLYIFFFLLTISNVSSEPLLSQEGFESISKDDRNEMEVDLMNAQILINDDKFYLAEPIINKVSEKDPGFEEPYSILYRYYQSKGKLLKNLSVLEDIIFAINKKQSLL